MTRCDLLPSCELVNKLVRGGGVGRRQARVDPARKKVGGVWTTRTRLNAPAEQKLAPPSCDKDVYSVRQRCIVPMVSGGPFMRQNGIVWYTILSQSVQ